MSIGGDILVLDDEADYARMLVGLLDAEGFSAVMSTSPREVVRILKDRSFALLVADYMMPEMDGAALLAEVRKIRPGLPVIMVSGLMNTPELIKVANIGVTLVLEKPFDSNLFIDYVSRFVSRREEGESKSEGGDTNGVPKLGRYPRPAVCLSDSFPISAIAIQKLWEALANDRHVFISMPDEEEFRLLLGEVARWRGVQQGEIPQWRMRDLEEYRARSVLPESGKMERTVSSPVVAVNGFGASPVEQLLAVLRFLAFCDASDQSSENAFLYGFFGLDPSGELVELDQLPQPISDRLIAIPPLRMRPLDLATYATRILAEAGGKRLSLRSAQLLLQYELPGNFGQLRRILEDAAKAATLREISRQILVEAIARSDRRFSPLAESVDLLENYLLARQSEYLRHHARHEPDTAALASRIAAPDGAFASCTPWDAHSLFFPELAHSVP